MLRLNKRCHNSLCARPLPTKIRENLTSFMIKTRSHHKVKKNSHFILIRLFRCITEGSTVLIFAVRTACMNTVLVTIRRFKALNGACQNRPKYTAPAIWILVYDVQIASEELTVKRMKFCQRARVLRDLNFRFPTSGLPITVFKYFISYEKDSNKRTECLSKISCWERIIQKKAMVNFISFLI